MQRLSAIKSVYDYGFARPDNRFIPVAVDDLIELLSRDTQIFGVESHRLRDVAAPVTQILEQEMSTFERATSGLYSNFNPDRETLKLEDISTGVEPQESELIDRVHHMLEKANFEQLSHEQVEAAIQAANTHGMRIRLDLERVNSLSIWVRGRSQVKQRRRTWTNPIRGVEVDVAIFNRLALIASMKDDQHVHLRLFKKIPIRDVEALLPHARVRMGRKDMAMMVGGGLGAVWSVGTKLTVLTAAAFSQLLWVVALPLAGLAWKVFSGYRRATKDRDSHRARHLYYQTLGANMSAVHMLANMICDEEIKEALILYAFCSEAARATLHPESFDDLDRLIRNYLNERLGVDVDFDMDDAVETLDRLGLWQDRESMCAVGVDEAVGRLEEHRKSRRSANYHTGLLGIGPSAS